MIFNLGLENYGLLALRLAVAAVFFVHGTSKLKSWGKLPGFMRFIGTAETFGALSMLLGLWTQLSGLGLAIIMLGAIYSKKFKWNVPYNSDKTTGWEFDSVLLAAALALVTLGAGTISVDALLGLI